MKTYTINSGETEMEVTVYDCGMVDIDIRSEHYGWNDGNAATACDIELTRDGALELLHFLQNELNV